MSKKKTENFGVSPFKALKGLSLSRQAETPGKVAPVRREEARTYDFASEMEQLGVKTLPADERIAPVVPAFIQPPVAALPVAAEELDDTGLFLHAMQGMEVAFTDEIPELELPLATPRRLKLVEQGKLRPSERLDLHGFTRSEARRRVAHFLENAIHHDYPLVLIITGWGKNGSGEAILREEIARFLRNDGAALVSEWAQAPGVLGGDGALLVFPKRRKTGSM